MIPSGLPASSDDWPEGLLDHLRRFEQGHLVEGLPFFYFTDPANPVFELAGHADELVWDAEEFPYGVIVTQTCDLQEDGVGRPRKPWAHCCPVYRADEPERGLPQSQHDQAKKDLIEYLVCIPQVPKEGIWVADLRLIMPVDKGWFLTKEPIDGFPDEKGRRSIGRKLALLHNRPAFDGVLIDSVANPLTDALKNLAKNEKALYEAMNACVYALGVRTDRLAEMTLESVELILLCWSELSDEAETWWQQQSELWSQNAQRSSDHRLQSLQIRLLKDVPADKLLRLHIVPLRGMTPHPLWFLD